MRYHLSMHCVREREPTLLDMKFQSTSSSRARPSSSFSGTLEGEGTSAMDRVTVFGGLASLSSFSCTRCDVLVQKSHPKVTFQGREATLDSRQRYLVGDCHKFRIGSKFLQS